MHTVALLSLSLATSRFLAIIFVSAKAQFGLKFCDDFQVQARGGHSHMRIVTAVTGFKKWSRGQEMFSVPIKWSRRIFKPKMQFWISWPLASTRNDK